MHLVLALLLLAHAVAHLPGFLVAWRIATLQDLPYKTTVLAGAFDVGDAGIRAIGLLWLLASIAFVVCSAALLLRTSWWLPATVSTALFSLGLCVLGWPDSRIGVGVNAVVLAFVVIGRQLDKLP